MTLSHRSVHLAWTCALLCACGPKLPAPPRSSEHQVASPAIPDSTMLGAIAANGDTAFTYRYVIRDSAGLFDPGGYWSPVDTIIIGSRQFDNLSILAVWYYYGGQLHYDRPEVLTPPVAIVTGAKCTHVVASMDTVSIACPGSVYGDIAFDGHFVRASTGACFGGVDLVARVVVRQGASVVHDKEHRFTCFGGD